MFEFCLVFVRVFEQDFFLSGDQISIMQEVAVSRCILQRPYLHIKFSIVSTLTSGTGEQ